MALKTYIKIDEFEEFIIEKIKHDLEDMAREQFEIKKKEMIEKLDREKDQVIAGITINIMDHIKMETFGKELVITVHTDKLKS